VIVYGFVIAGWTLALNYAGANGNWILYFLPVTTSPGIFPVIFTLVWSRQTKLAATISPLVGLTAGIAVWIGLAYSMYGEVSITSTSGQMPALYGSLTSLFTPALLSIVISLLRPERFDWREFLRIGLIEDNNQDQSGVASSSASQVQDDEKPHSGNVLTTVGYVATGESDSSGKPQQKVLVPAADHPVTDFVHPFDEATLRKVRMWLRIAIGFLLLNIAVTILIWPLSLYRDYIFGKTLFKSWVTVAILWQFFALCAVVIYPLVDGRHAIAKGIKGIWLDLQKRSQGKKE